MAGFPDDKEKAVIAGGELNNDSTTSITALVFEDHQHDIKLRTMSWQKAAWLLCGDQVCLAIMAQTWSLSVLGWGPGIVTMIVAGVLFWITSMTMWKFIMDKEKLGRAKNLTSLQKYPQIKDICDFGYYAFGKSKIAYEFTGFMLLANNIMLIGFHVLTGAKILNTLSDHSQCTIVFNVIILIMGIVMSLPRTLHHVSYMSMISGKSANAQSNRVGY
ncbi:hypothetical protein LTR22_002477 [Elasticomyces elasticus]|nr:hypothetical protein LTR22_002477 [Elasticomyces elasticus]